MGEAFTGSIICTSHFTPFLDKMCTHIIDFQDRKLKTFKGDKGRTLTMFVEKYPDKKSYFKRSMAMRSPGGVRHASGAALVASGARRCDSPASRGTGACRASLDKTVPSSTIVK